MRQKLKKVILFLKNGAIFCISFLGFWLVVLYLFQNYIVFARSSREILPSERGLEHFEQVRIDTPDGETLIAWYKKPQKNGRIALFFHGNAGTLGRFAPFIQESEQIFDGILAIDYRGFGGSTGHPTSKGIMIDAESSIKWLKKQGINTKDIVVMGYSLGTAPAVHVAAREEISALVLYSPYSSIKDIAKYRFPIFPVDYLLDDNIDAMQDIGEIKAPLFVLHGDKDFIIPIHIDKKLYDAAPVSKYHMTLKGGGHRFLYSPGSISLVKNFLDHYAPF